MADGVWSRDFFTSELTASLVAALDGERDADTLRRAVDDCAAAAEGVCCNRPMACGAGCPHCCVLNVAILLPEGMLIAIWLQQQLPADQLDAVRERLAVYCCRVRWMDDEERIFKRATCPFLDGAGSCSIHPVRPLSCRGVASLDRDSCREAFSPMTADQERLVPADLLRRGAFDVGFVVLSQALGHHGFDDRSIELGTGVLAFLERPELSELLLSGGRFPRELWE